MSKDKWSALSAQERAQLINIYIQSGITDLDFIKKDYNSFDEGGSIEYTTPSPKDDDINIPYKSVITSTMREDFISKSKNKFNTFVEKMYPIVERSLVDAGHSTDNLNNILRQMAQESNYGLSPRGNGYNLSGIKAWNNKEGTKHKDGYYYRNFKDYKDYVDYHVALLNNRYDALNAEDTKDFVYRLHHTKDGRKYSGDERGYMRNLNRMTSLDKAIKNYETNNYSNGGRILDGSTEDNQTLDNTPWYKKIPKALIEGARMGRDARIGAVGAEPLREMYANGQSEEADRLAKQYVRANTAGIGISAGAASSSLLADLLTTAGTTIIDTIGDGDSKNLAKDVTKNAIGDLLGFGAGKALNHFIDLDIIKKAFKDGRLRIGEPTTYTAYHQSDNPITQFTFPYKKRWDVVTHGADPNTAFFTVDNPAASGFLSKRPYTSKFDVTVKRPLIQTGEINGATKNSMRNKIVKRARKLGADGVLYEGIADNQLKNQRILQAFENADINHINTDVNYANLSDSQLDELYNKTLADNNLTEAQRIRDLHFKTKSPDNVFINPDGSPAVNYHGSPETFNEFNINFFGRTDPGDHGVGFYFTPDKEYAEWYGQTRPFYLYGKSPYIGKHSSMLNRGKNAQQLITKHKIDTDKAAERSTQHMLQQQKENTPSKMYEAFGFTKETSEKEIRDAVKKYYNEVHDNYIRTLGNIDVADSYKSIDENVIFNPNHIKLSDLITYDDTGNIIPLSKRDNFNSSDIRYGLLPFIGMSSIKDDKNIKADGGLVTDKKYTYQYQKKKN